MAMELFQTSTMDAVKSGLTDSVVVTEDQRRDLQVVETQIKRCVRVVDHGLSACGCLSGWYGFTWMILDHRRVAIGSYVSERKLVDELVRVGLNDHLVRKALMYLTQSGDLQLVRERRMVHRLR